MKNFNPGFQISNLEKNLKASEMKEEQGLRKEG